MLVQMQIIKSNKMKIIEYAISICHKADWVRKG